MKITLSSKHWSKVNLPNRLFYLESCRHNLRRLAGFWVEEEAALRGHLPNSMEGAESWLLGPVPVARMFRYLINGVKSGGRPHVPSRRFRIDGRSVTRVFPHGFHESLLFYDTEAHVWSIGGQLQGQHYRRARDSSPGACLVLGASNVSSIAATDLLCKLFCENRPVLCKLPPRFAPLRPIFEEIFHPLIRDRHVQIVCGGKDLGEELLDLPIFENIHLTGSLATFRALKESNRYPERIFTAELGCVTPVILAPGPWSQAELLYQARHLASLMVLNGGYNCVTPQILVMAKNWSYRSAFLRALKEELQRFASRDDHFEGSAQRRREFRADYPEREDFGPRSIVALRADEETRLFAEESFCGMLGWVELESERPAEFLEEAARFCNQRLWGDLSCLLLVDPNTRRVNERAIARTLAALQYGTIGVNAYQGLAFSSGVTPWGSYLDGKAETGTGWVHNTFFFDRPEKTVLEAGFLPPTPLPWVKPFPNLFEVGARLFELELNTTPVSLMRFAKAYGKALLLHKRRKSRG